MSKGLILKIKMDNNLLKTSVDDLYEIVKSREKISVEEAAKMIRMPMNVVQSLIDFLVEEKIFGIEYKFTTPYVYLNKKRAKKYGLPTPPPIEREIMTKDSFYGKSAKWNLPKEKIDELWRNYLRENIENIREVFYKKARLRNIADEKINKLWDKYKAQIQ